MTLVIKWQNISRISIRISLRVPQRACESAALDTWNTCLHKEPQNKIINKKTCDFLINDFLVYGYKHNKRLQNGEVE